MIRFTVQLMLRGSQTREKMWIWIFRGLRAADSSASESLDLYTCHQQNYWQNFTREINNHPRLQFECADTTRGYNLSVLIIMLLVLCWSILLNSVIGQQILTPDDMRIVRDNDKFLYKYLPQVVKKIV